jgi:hypothetical protein
MSVKLVNRRRIVAHEHHVAPRLERRPRALGYPSGGTGAFHAEVVTEYEPIELQLFAQDTLEPRL